LKTDIFKTPILHYPPHPFNGMRYVCVHNTSLTPPLFIEVSVPTQKSERSCMIFILDFGIVPTVWYFLFSFYSMKIHWILCRWRRWPS